MGAIVPMSFRRTLKRMGSDLKKRRSRSQPQRRRPRGSSYPRDPFAGLQTGITKPVSGGYNESMRFKRTSMFGSDNLRYYGQDPTGQHIYASHPRYAGRVNRRNWSMTPDGMMFYHHRGY